MGTIAKITAGGTTHLVASSAYGTCSTGASTAAKVVTMSNFDTLITGMTIHVYFTYSNTATNPTLNVNSKGAKPIYKYGTTVPGTTAATSWQAGSIVSFTYNTNANSNGCWMMNDHLDDTNTNTTYTASTTSIGSASTGTAISADDITAWTTNTPTVVTPATVVTGGTTASITPVTKKTVVTSASGATAAVSNGVLTLTNGSFDTGDSVTNGTAVTVYKDLTTGPAATVTAGTAASLSYTSKTIPNISVTSKDVVTGITAN